MPPSSASNCVLGTPLAAGTVAPIDSQGNLYLAGTVGFSFGIQKIKLGMNGAAWVLIKYTSPAEVVLSVETGPSLTLWNKLSLDLK